MDIRGFLMKMFQPDQWREQEVKKYREFVPAPKDSLGNITDYNWEMYKHDGTLPQGLAEMFRQIDQRRNNNTRDVDWQRFDKYDFMRHGYDWENLVRSRNGV